MELQCVQGKRISTLLEIDTVFMYLQVLKILCQKRIGKDDFAASIRKILEENFKDKFIGTG